METGRTTSWTVIEGAAAGQREDREAFAQVYLPVVRRTLAARWSGGPLRSEIDDAVSEVFVECLRPGGAITRVRRGDAQPFRAYLWGVTRNVARAFEKRRRAHSLDSAESPDELPDGDDSRLGQLFDRAYVEAILAEALRRLIRNAGEKGSAAERRVELLRLRLHEGLAIREIARALQEEAADLHRQYAHARPSRRTTGVRSGSTSARSSSSSVRPVERGLGGGFEPRSRAGASGRSGAP